MTRIQSLDLLRGVAAFAVAIPHLLLFAYPGNIALEAAASLGVEVFFVLSGYVLAPQIMRCFEQPRDLGTFLARRWMRTIPPYILALVAVSLAAGQLGTDDFVRYAVYFQNFLWQGNTIDYFSIAWSLSVEEWFYVVFPVVLIIGSFAVGTERRSAIILALAFIAVISAGRTVYGDYSAWGEEVRRVVIFRLDAIAFGFLLYLVPHQLGRWSALLSFALTLAFGAGTLVAVISSQSWLAQVAFPFAAAAFGAASIALSLSFEGAILKRRWLRFLSKWLGRTSFSIYLFHQVFAMLIIDGATWRYSVSIAICILAMTAFSVLFYRFFEKPILDARPAYKDRQGEVLPSDKVSEPLSDIPVATTEM